MGIIRFLLVFSLLVVIPLEASADWYILIPKRKPTKREMPKEVPLPKLKEKKKSPLKPYKVEIKRIISPDFSLRTSELKRVSKSDFENKVLVIAFIRDVYSPQSEAIASILERIAEDGKVGAVLVDVNDADFPELKRFKAMMGLKRVIVTADSYVFKEFKAKVGKLDLPAVVVIDKFGFIRYFARNLKVSSEKKVIALLKDIINEMG